MINTLLAKKQNMSTVFNRFGFHTPVTFVVAEPNIVIWQKEQKALIGLGKSKKIKKTESAIAKTTGYTPRFLKEIKLQNPQENQSESQTKLTPGSKITVSIFAPGDEVKVTGITKGRGFAGVIKRHGFHGGPKTHGQSDRHRAPGSIGTGTTPGRVWKGKKMAGHMGDSKLTVTGLEVIDVDETKNIIVIKGSIPGAKNGLLIVEKTGKVKGYTPPPAPNEEKQAEKEEKAAQQGEPRSQSERAEAEAKEAKKEPEEGPEGPKESKATKETTSVPSDSSAPSETSNIKEGEENAGK